MLVSVLVGLETSVDVSGREGISMETVSNR